MTIRTRLAKSRHLASTVYRHTVGEIVQRKRSRAYVAREQSEGRTVSPLLPGRTDVTDRAPAGISVPQRAIPARERRTTWGRSAR